MNRFFLLSLLLLSSLTQAVPVKDLYSATVESKDRSNKSFTSAAERAFVKVLVKTSGRSIDSITREPRIAQDLNSATKLVERFSYHHKETEGGGNKLFINVTFAEDLVNDVLQRGDLSLWPNNRPLTLVLPVVQKSSYKTLIRSNIDDSFQFSGALKHHASEYGLPITTALKANRAQLESIWSFKQKGIDNIGASIGHDNIFVARVAVVSSGSFIGAWFLVENGKTYSVDVSAKSANEFVRQGFSWLAKHYSSQYALALVNDLNEYQLKLSNVHSMETYDDAIDYLKNHDLIDHVYLLEASSEVLIFSLVLKSNTDQLKKSFQLDNKMRVNEQSKIVNVMDYSWR